MQDLALNSDFSVFLNDRNDLATVDEQDEFEQSVRVKVTDYMNRSLIGQSTEANIENKIRLQVSRVARGHDRLDGISNIDISQSEEKPHTFTVRIDYESEAVSEFEVSE